LSARGIRQLTQRLQEPYETLDRQDLPARTFVYVWADGIDLKAGIGTEKACLRVLLGAAREGREHRNPGTP